MNFVISLNNFVYGTVDLCLRDVQRHKSIFSEGIRIQALIWVCGLNQWVNEYGLKYKWSSKFPWNDN